MLEEETRQHEEERHVHDVDYVIYRADQVTGLERGFDEAPRRVAVDDQYDRDPLRHVDEGEASALSARFAHASGPK